MSKMEVKIVVAATDRFTQPAKHMGHSSDVLSEKLIKAQKGVEALTNTAKNLDSFKQVKKDIIASTAALEEYQQQSQQAAKAMRKTAQQVKTLEQALMDEKKASGESSKAYKQLSKDLTAAKKAHANASKTQQQAAASTKRAKQALTEESAVLQRLRDKLQQAGISTKGLSQAQAKLKKDVAHASTAIEREATRMAKLAASTERFDRAMMRAANISFVADSVGRTGDMLTGALSAPLNKAIEFETAMAGIAKTTDFTPAGLTTFADKIKDMTKRIPMAASGLASIAAMGGQLGIDSKDLDKFTVSIAKMSIALDIPYDQVAESMAKMAKVYHIPIVSIDTLADKINTLSNNSPSKAREIVDAMRRIGSTASQFGLVSHQAAALSSTMISLGETPETASTAINSLLQKMQTAEKQGNKFKGALGSMGMSATDLADAVKNDAQGALTMLLEQINQLDGKQRTGVLVDLLGTEFADNIGTLVNGIGEYKKQLKIASNDALTAGSSEREFQKNAAITASKIQLMQNRWDALQIKLGDKMIPILERLMPVIESVIDGFDRFVTNNGTLVTGVLALTAGIAGVAIVVAPVLTAIAALIGSLAGLGWASRKASIEVAARGGKKAAAAGLLKSAAGKAGLIGSSALASYAIGSWFNTQIDKAVIAATAGDNKTFGGLMYDTFNNAEPIVAAPVAAGAQYSPTYHINMDARGNQDAAQLVNKMEQEFKRRDEARGRSVLANRESDL